MNPLFDTVIERRNTNSLKWNVEEDTIAMWVADMDFRTAPCIQKAMQNTAALGIYGYCEVRKPFIQVFRNGGGRSTALRWNGNG